MLINKTTTFNKNHNILSLLYLFFLFSRFVYFSHYSVSDERQSSASSTRYMNKKRSSRKCIHTVNPVLQNFIILSKKQTNKQKILPHPRFFFYFFYSFIVSESSLYLCIFLFLYNLFLSLSIFFLQTTTTITKEK